jgi:hypothetical protein
MTATAGASGTAYERVLAQIKGLTIDSTTGRSVEGVLIEHGIMTFMLESGTIAHMKTVEGRRVGSVFIGKGTVTFQPNTTTEQVNLTRFYPSSVFQEDITQIVFVCTDNTISDQVDAFPATKDVSEHQKVAENVWSSMLFYNEEREFSYSLARTILNGYATSVFRARADRGGDMSASLGYNPYDEEPYRLDLIRMPNRPKLGYNVCMCPDVNGPTKRTGTGISRGDLALTIQHNISIELDRSLDLKGVDRVDFTVVKDSLRTLDLDLYPTLEVDSITMAGVGKLPFYRPKKSSSIWVDLPRAHAKDEKFSVTVHYHGDVFERYKDYIILVTSTDWYPSHSGWHHTFFDVEFTYPKSMTLAAVGSRSSMKTTDDVTISRWNSGRQLRNYSFHVGFFKREEVPNDPSIPRGAVLYLTGDQIETVAMDIKQSLEFYTKLFGTLPVDSLIATELPGNHGEAFPGLLHLSSYAFYVADDAETDRFFSESFTSHEIAHQWFGVSVDWASYRDQWVSEGFAEYCALMYSQLASRDSDKFFSLLEEYRKEIVSFGKKDIGKDLPPPAIAIGYRARAGAASDWAYNIFVYRKGAWVLHMLRNMMLNLQTMKEDVFMKVMREFYARHKGKPTSTEDFQKTIEDVTGVNVQWFFDQWVYGNKIPTYTYAYKSEKQADGTYKNFVRVKQSGVPDSFQMYIPIKVVLDDGTFARYHIMMKGAEATMELPTTKSEIDELIFNDLASVLCETQKESF